MTPETRLAYNRLLESKHYTVNEARIAVGLKTI
jgi:hypothetical protein